MLNTKYKIGMRDMRYEMQNVKGFSLIELVFAMSFLTLIVFGVVKLQSSNLAMMGGNNNQIQANLHANQALQIVEAIGYTAIDNAYKNCGPIKPPCSKQIRLSGNNYELAANPPEEIDPFKRTIEIWPQGLTSAYLIKTIIEWEDATGEHKKSDNSHVEARRIIY